MTFKFEKLDVWELAMAYIDTSYRLADSLPAAEAFNLGSQIRRAATSIALNIAEGSTGPSNAEQSRFLTIAIRSLVETVACLHLIRRRKYSDEQMVAQAYRQAELLAARLHAFRKSLDVRQAREVHEGVEEYIANERNSPVV